MAQFARPAADVLDTGWYPQPVFAQINERFPGDSTYVASQSNPPSDTFEVDLPTLARPLAGAHRVTVRMRKTEAGGSTVTVSLIEGDNLIAARAFQPTQSFAMYTFQLTQAEINRIVLYANLRLRLTAGGIVTPCCANPIPALLHVTATGHGTGQIVWNGVDGWAGMQTMTGGTCEGADLFTKMFCDVDHFEFAFGCGIGFSPGTENSVTCSPFSASSVAVLDIIGCPPLCGVFTVTITE